jgi:NAD(P)-dependent dehydrogenase (short-subunit alcohol dehydrogenase family)
MAQSIPPISPEYYIPDRFKGKTILITGAADGIGGATALRAAREGANLVAVDKKAEALATTVARIKNEGGSAIAVVADVSRTQDADRMVAEAVSTYGGLDLALNAAGVMDGTDPAKSLDFERDMPLMPAAIHQATDEYWENTIASNSTGMFRSLRAELRQLVAQNRGGAIVCIGSIAAIIGLPGNPAYVASKHSVTGLVRNAAIDYAPYGIRVNSVNMAQTATPMVERAYEFVEYQMTQGHGSSMASAKSHSLLSLAASDHRGSTTWEQAAVILFLLSDEASNLTGASYATDDGWTTY